MEARETKWVPPYHKRNLRAVVRLFCFPYAGGSASVYVRSLGRLTPLIEVCPVQLPGRENRLSEPYLTSVADVARAVAAAQGLRPYFDMEFAFFGHSLGALLAYESIQTLWQTGGPLPKHLIVSAHRAPHIPLPHEPTWQLPDTEFKQRVKELNGTPGEVLEHPELQALMLPLIRADFRLDETYSPSPAHQVLHCPVTVFGGTRDGEVPESHLRAWSQWTNDRFDLKMIEGDHFFIHSHSSTLTALISDALRTRGCPV
jgi:medium-chain acyl-[acyl-carrier-protein] hydrolase